jgi:hypothetical protein
LRYATRQLITVNRSNLGYRNIQRLLRCRCNCGQIIRLGIGSKVGQNINNPIMSHAVSNPVPRPQNRSTTSNLGETTINNWSIKAVARKQTRSNNPLHLI